MPDTPGASTATWRRPAARAVTGLLRTVRLYGFAAWAYIAGNSIVHPATMRIHLTHLANWPHENTFGVVCFGASLGSAMTLTVRTRRRQEPRVGGPAPD